MGDEEYNPGNESYTITFGSPLLPPGIELSTETSGKYFAKTMHYMMQEVRKFNSELSRRGPSGVEKKVDDQSS